MNQISLESKQRIFQPLEIEEKEQGRNISSSEKIVRIKIEKMMIFFFTSTKKRRWVKGYMKSEKRENKV